MKRSMALRQPQFSFSAAVCEKKEKEVPLVQVAIPLPVDDPFTYRVPEALSGGIKPGIRVRVPFKNREITGYVTDCHPGCADGRTKPVIAILDEEPILSEHMMRLTHWMKDYYFSSWGEAIRHVIPKKHKFAKRLVRQDAAGIDRQTKAGKKELVLTDEQEKALDIITALLKSKVFHEALLFGVTGSGKSEIYIRAMKIVLSMGKSAICLVPEIALTEQLKLFFSGHFGTELEIVHSKLSDRERWEAWNRIRKGEKTIVLGARSAVFAPFKNLGLIVIDEEQEPSYKQDQTPRYHAREAARWRVRELGALLLLGSATPSVESVHGTNQKNILRINLTKRVDSKKLPNIEIVDLKQASEIAKKRIMIAPKLQEAIGEAFHRRNGVLLLLNRRGFSTQVQCSRCAQSMMCRSCDLPMTFHQSERKLICHYCNYQVDEPETCPHCQSPLFRFNGIGTEKVESEVARLFPRARVARMDSDSVRRKGSHEQLLAQFRAQKIDILVGTQMIAKGFDFPHVTLVGVVLADTALALPDFRSSEKTFQLLTQVAGRSGRGKEEGKVIVQTYSPFHYSIQMTRAYDAQGFYEKELRHRRDFLYPPYVQLINVLVSGRKESQVAEQAMLLKSSLAKEIPAELAELIGPSRMPFYKLRGSFRQHIMLKNKIVGSTHKKLRCALREVKRLSKVRVTVDTDPLTIL